MHFKSWIRVSRVQFLALPVILVFYGSAVAYYDGFVSVLDSLIALIGLLCLHLAVNLFNEYYDFVSELDMRTVKTPFSGGSGVLPAGLVVPKRVYIAAEVFSVMGFAVGVYFLLSKGIFLLPILVLGAICVVFYTPYLTRFGLGEFAAGMGLGFLPILGTYFVIAERFSVESILSAIPAGLLTSGLLLLNEFPDYEPDRSVGRKNLIIVFGKEKAIVIYAALILLSYISVLLNVLFGFAPRSCFIVFLTMPLAYKTIFLAMKSYNSCADDMLAGLASNVKLVLLTQFLIAVGYFVARF